jgi:hypothetical protein
MGCVHVKRECYTLCRTQGQTEKTLSVGGRDVAQLEGIISAGSRDAGERVGDPGRLVPLSPEWNRSKIRRIGFDQQPIWRHQPEQFDVSPFLECHDPAERHVPTGGDGVLRQRMRAGVAVQDTDHSGVPRLRDVRTGVVFRFPGVDHDRTLHLRCERDLSGKRGALGIPR